MAYAYQPTYPVADRPNTATVINIGHVTRVLADYDLGRNKIFRGGTRTPNKYLAILLGMEVEILEWAYTYTPNASTLTAQTNYVWALIGNYAGAALRALGNGSGIVINPTTGSPINLIGYRVDFTIGEAGSLMNAGDSSVTITLPGFIRDTLDFFFSGVSDSIGDTTQVSITSITWNPLFITIFFNQPVLDGQRIEIRALRATSGTISGGGSTSPIIPLPLEKGKFLSNDGNVLVWDEPLIKITSADFEANGVTYLDARLAYHDIEIRWEDVPVLLDPETQYTTILSGGFTINIADFDANSNEYTLTITQKGFTS